MISVIIPVHNQAQTLARALKSVCNQDVEDLEIVVVDDGSTDDLEGVLSKVSKQRLTCLHQPQLGPAAARNAGIKASRGELIAFLDADDFWLPEKLKAQVATMKQTGRGFSFCGSQVVDERGKVLAIRPAADDDGEFSQLIWGNRFPTPSVLVERSLLDRCGGFDESLFTGEDWDLWLRLSAEGPGACVPEQLVAVTGRAQWEADASQLRNYEHSVNTILARIFETAAAREELKGVLSQKKQIRSWHYAVLAKSFLHAGDFGKGLRYAARAVATSPSGLIYLRPGNSGNLPRDPHVTSSNASTQVLEDTTADFDVSVLIRTYNRAAMLADALDSALNQTLPAKEIVVIDDGSTDETPRLVESYRAKNPHVRYIRTVNLGPGHAARRGVEECRSRYIAFLDSDDLWSPHHLEKVAAKFAHNPAAVLVFTKYGLASSEREQLVASVREPPLSDAPLSQLLLKQIIVQPTRTVALRSAIVDIGGYPAVGAGEDWVLSVLIASRFPVGVIQSPATTAFFRMHGSQSFARPLELQKSLLDATDYAFARLPEDVQQLKPRVISTHLLHSAIFLWQAGETREAWRSLIRAIKVRNATLATKEFARALMRLVVPASIGKLVRESKRFFQRKRSVNSLNRFSAVP